MSFDWAVVISIFGKGDYYWLNSGRDLSGCC